MIRQTTVLQYGQIALSGHSEGKVKSSPYPGSNHESGHAWDGRLATCRTSLAGSFYLKRNCHKSDALIFINGIDIYRPTLSYAGSVAMMPRPDG